MMQLLLRSNGFLQPSTRLVPYLLLLRPDRPGKSRNDSNLAMVL